MWLSKRRKILILIIALIGLTMSSYYIFLTLEQNKQIEKIRERTRNALLEEMSSKDWPIWQHNRRNVGRSFLGVNMTPSPVVAWKYFLGGGTWLGLLKDVNHDGSTDIITAYGGKLIVREAGGDEVWESPLIGASDIIGVYDLDEDGVEDVVAVSSSPPRIYILSGMNGSLEWSYNFGSPASGLGTHGIKIAHLEPYGKGMQLIVWPQKSEYGYAFTFSDGVNKGRMLWNTTASEALNFPPPLVIGDMDLDGKLEVVIAAYDTVYVFNGQNGSLKQKAVLGTGRSYGALILKDVDKDLYPEIFILADSVRDHIALVQNDQGNIHLSWDKFFEQDYPTDFKTLRATINSIADIDQDGEFEIIASLYNDTGDSRWHLMVWNALTGSTESDMIDTYLWGIQDIDGDNFPEILVSHETTRIPSALSTIYVLKYTGSYCAIVWSMEVARFVMDYSPAIDLEKNTISSQVEVFVKVLEHGLRRFFLVDGQNSLIAFNCSASATSIYWIHQAGVSINVLGFGDADGDGSVETLVCGSDGYLRIIDERGVEEKRLETGGFVGSPVAAKLTAGGNVNIIVQNSLGQIVVLGLNAEGKPVPLWYKTGIGKSAKYGRGASAFVCDLEGDGSAEILIGDITDSLKPKLVLLNSNGTEKRSWTLGGNPFEWTVGDFNGDSILDIFVSFYAGGPHVAKSYVLDGKTGNLLWEKPYGPHSGYVAVFDANGDGKDDIIMREHFQLHILDGSEGKDLVEVSELCGYHTPIVAEVDGDGYMEIIWGAGWGSLTVDKITYEVTGGIKIKEKWRRIFGGGDTTEIYGRMPGVADLDNDGVLEIVVNSMNTGYLYCYDGSTGDLKWEYNLGTVTSDIIAADVDNDGKPELIFGAIDGKLYAINGEKSPIRRVEWALDFGYTVGSPIVADISGDGKAEILVPVADGFLYVLSGS